jgi:hypothetical protein
MDPEVLALLARLNDETNPLTDEELATVESALAEHGRSIVPSEATQEDITVLAEVVENLNAVRAAINVRAEAAAERAAQAAALLEQVGPGAEVTPAEPAEPTEGEPAEVVAEVTPGTEPGDPAAPVEVVAEVPSEVVPVEVVTDPTAQPAAPVPVAAAGTPAAPAVSLPRISRLAARRPERARPQPALTASANGGEPLRPTLLASADIPGLSAGSEVSLDQFARGAQRRIEAVKNSRNQGADGEKVYFGTIRSPMPESRQLDMEDPDDTARKLDAVTSQAALVASGGICGPVDVDYNVTTIATNQRPLLGGGALAVYQATRGGLRYTLPLTLAQVTADGPAAIWTEANDANPTNPTTKPHALFACQPVFEAYVDAITSIVQFGNFHARYFPEQITEFMTVADAVHARLAEGNLLATISAGSTQVAGDEYELGAARDLLAVIDRAGAAMRYRHRMAPNTPLRFIEPLWLRAMLRSDMVRQLPGDSGTTIERLATTDAQIDAWFAQRNINVTDVQDSPLGASTSQGWGIQGNGQLLPWPLQTSVWLYPEGTWVFMDGGELNLGMVRDSVLNATNDFQMFSETFEKAIFRGHESLQLNLKLAPTGASMGTVTPPSDGTETIGS